MATTYDVLFRLTGPDPSTTVDSSPGHGVTESSATDEGSWSLTPDARHPGALDLRVTVLADDASLAEVEARRLLPELLGAAGLEAGAVAVEEVDVRVPG